MIDRDGRIWPMADIPKGDVCVMGVAPPPTGLTTQGGDIDVTVFRNVEAQGAGGPDSALTPDRGETVQDPVFVLTE